MGRQKLEPTRSRSIRLPEKLWELLVEVSRREYRSTNAQIQKLIEDFLVDEGMMENSDRRQPIDRRKHNQ
jgi:hypothetical protein